MRVVRLLAGLLLGAFAARGQTSPCPTEGCDPALLARRSLTAVRISGAPPAIDGRLDEPAWSEAPVATGFTQNRPRPGAPSALRSEARVLVDDEAIYVGLTYFDSEPAKIQAPLARRDDETISDWSFVEIDSRHDRRSGFSFGVNPRGVQVDGLWADDIVYDPSWNAVWESAARVNADGWTVEVRIPFSQLAFSLPSGAAEGVEMVWGINFYRNSPARGESSNWSPRYSGLGGVVSHFNDLHLPAPSRVHRFEATPYVAPRVGNDGPEGERKSSIRAGADLKVGLGSSFSLTATLLPDFGQVEADPSQVNLTAFELFQAEQRPFFLEGIDVFRMNTSLAFATRDTSFADESPFYSRRVGRAPRGDLPPEATAVSFPTATTLLGAVKLSGQTPSGWTLGVFTAESDRERALLDRQEGGSREWPVEARTTSTVARAIRSFDHGESSFGLFAADLHRFALGPVLAAQEVSDAAALGAELQHRFGGGRYELRSWALGSRLTGDAEAIARVAEAPNHDFQRPDARDLPRAPYGTSLAGLAAETRVSRLAGNLLWDVTARAVTPGFDVDELGFQRNSDWLLLAGDWKYQRFTPGHWLRDWTVGSGNLGLGWTWAGESRARVADVFLSVDTRDYWTAKVAATREASALSTGWLRGGPALLLPPRTTLSLSIATDQRKASYVTLDASAAEEGASGSRSLRVTPLVNLRVSDRLQMSAGATYETDTVGWQPVGAVDGTPADILVARLRQETLSLTLRSDLTFTPRLALQAYLQPFSTAGRYDRYQRLIAPRDPRPERRFALLDEGSALPVPSDATHRTLNGDLVLRWEYRPGSFLTAVWNHQRDRLVRDLRPSAEDGLTRLFGDPPTNVVLLKLSWRFGT
ncbi:MAG TPA: DUF5916 domain-containing protein [Thermoanaerobaculia bacterium]|jgi:hypothetical protein|nr:DUF5916 domain-containing protein [Thermoanaerobaculia bacterium]